MNRNSVVTGIALGLAGFAVNWFKFELFFDVHLLFGSIVSMFAIMRFGLATGTIAALVASACTWYHWHHPWAIVTWTAEAFFAGLVAKRSRWSLLAGDFFYWISGGLLLGYLFNEYFIGASLRTVLLITLKQGINGIFNTLVATGLYIAFACENRGTRDLPTMFQTLFTSLAIFILVPVMGYFYFGINDSFHRRLRDYCADTAQICDIAEQDVALWLADRRYAVQALADLAGSVAHMEQPELQRIVETMHAAHPDFKRMVIVNKSSVTRACAPRLDEYGVSTIGIDLSTRSYNAILRSYSASRNPLSHPLLFDLFRGEAIGVKGPKLRIIAPVFVRGAYGGAASGVLNLASLQEVLQEIAGTSAMAITVVDQRGNVVVGTKTSLKPLTPYTPPQGGTVIPVGMGVSHWEPEQRPGVPVSNRWYASVYFKEKTIAAGNGWKVVVEAPIRPLVEEISQQTMVLFEVIIALIVTVIGLSRVHAARYSLSVRQLVDVTRQLPERCSSGEEVVWPHSMSREMSGLIANFQVMAAAIHRDIKEMEHLNESLEQRVAERTQELREAIQFSEQVIQSAQEGIAVHDLELHYLAWNPFMETLSGITADRVLGRHPAEIFPHLIETGTIARLESVAAGGPPTSMDIQFRDAVSGKTKWVSELSAPLCNSKGVIIGAITTVRDISNRKRMEELARCALDNAIGANNTMKRLLRVIAHEFRTPLGLLTGCTDILDRYWDRLTPEKRSEQNGHIRRAARQLSKLLESVVAFNHLGTETPVERPLADIGGLCRTIAAEAEINWGGGQTFTVSIAADCGCARLDEIRFRQILENLLNNAFRYTPSEGTVSLHVWREDGRVLVKVSDTGIGIREEDQELIFEAFYRSSNVEDRRGLGLGLSIVQEALSLTGGTITVASRVGEGTVMRVELPGADPEPAGEAALAT